MSPGEPPMLVIFLPGRAHSPIFTSLHLRHSSFTNPSVALPTPQLIAQPFRSFTYITAHSPTLLSLPLRHRLFTYAPGEPPMLVIFLPGIRAHSLIFPSLHLRHSSFSNTSDALPTPQLILQPFRCFTYDIGTSPTSPGEPAVPL